MFRARTQVEILDWPQHLHLQLLVVLILNKRNTLLRVCNEVAVGTVRRDSLKPESSQASHRWRHFQSCGSERGVNSIDDE